MMVTGDKVDDDCDGAKLSSPSMCKRLRHCRDGVVDLVVTASLPSPMRRRLSNVGFDGYGVTGDTVKDDRLCHCRDVVVALVAMVLLPLPMRRRLAVVNDDGDGATADTFNDDGHGKRATTSTMMVKVRRDGATGDEVDDDCNGAMGEEVNDADDGVRRHRRRHQLDDER